MKPVFTISYEIVTQESAEHGDVDARGIVENAETLRDALKTLFETRTNQSGGIESIEADEWPIRAPRWITVSNGMEFQSGAFESRSLHLPRNLTPATRRRIYRLIAN